MTIYDSIVVGGGPAGSTAARAMARAGLKVLLLEKEKMPRYKCCAGGIPRKVSELLDFDISPCCESPVRRVVFSWLSRKPQFPPDRSLLGWVVRRELFDHLLLSRARAAGTRVKEGCEFIGLEEDGDVVRVATTGGEVRGRTLIGADGARSRVARLLGLARHTQFGFALETRVRVPAAALAERRDCIYFDLGGVPGGYSWIFPLRDCLKVGVATRRSSFRGLRDCLRDYLEREGLNSEDSRFIIRGATLAFRILPFGLVKGRSLLAGDAGALIDRLTGEGISPAIRSGLCAARAVDDYLNGRSGLAAYQKLLRKDLGLDLFLANLLSRFAGTFPRLIFDLVCSDKGRINKAMAVIQGELAYRELFFNLS